MPTALVTGANRGIGLELCRQLKKRGEEVIAVCRRPSPELETLGARIEADCDLTSGTQVSALAERLTTTKLDLLVNNAGILSDESLTDLNLERIQQQFEVNAVAPLRFTRRLLANMAQGAKIAMITSRMGSIADNSSGGRYGYRMSKAALNIASVSLAHDLKPRGIAVAILHPGWVRTDMTHNQGLIDVDEAARGLLARIDALSLATSGGFWHANGDPLPW